jgi:guanylate kinase
MLSHHHGSNNDANRPAKKSGSSILVTAFALLSAFIFFKAIILSDQSTDPKTVRDSQHDVIHRPLLISGPSGVGKGTLIERLMEFYNEEDGLHFKFSVSHTTRKPRPGEKDGVHYHFTDRTQMMKDVKNGKFIEHAEVHGNLYGTSYSSVQSLMEEGFIVILDIDIKGARKVQEKINPLSIFIAPPSTEILEQRLRDRRTESEEAIQKRIKNARSEVAYGTRPGAFDEVIVNDDLDFAFLTLRHILEERYPHVNTVPFEQHVEF